MARPAVLIVEPDGERRQALAHGLAASGYEVIPAASTAEGARFAFGLEPAVVVAPAALVRTPDGSVGGDLATAVQVGEHTLVLLGASREEEEGLAGEVVFLLAAGVEAGELVRRLRLVLVAREVGVEVDAGLEHLIGDLALNPLLELLRSLQRSQLSGRIELGDGAIDLKAGEVVAATAGPVTGVKAFCRLARLSEEPFRVRLDTPAVGRTVTADLNTLVVAAIKDSLGDFPDPSARLGLEMGDTFFTEKLSELQQGILRLAHRGATVQEALDALPATDGEVVQELLLLEERALVVRHAATPAVTVVTDSTADLPATLVRRHGITVVPLTVLFGEESFRDRVDLQPGQLYQKLVDTPVHPESRPPATADFAAVYAPALGRGDVVSLHLSSKLSLTCEHARAAAGAVLAGDARGRRLAVVDSRQVSFGLGLQALFAARLAARGQGADEIVRRLDALRERIAVFFVLDTLEYLARGGRIGKAQAWVGGLLRVKPILGLVGGEIEPVDRVLGRRNAYPRLVELVRRRIDPRTPAIVAISHARAPTWADRLRQLLEKEIRIGELILGEVGPVVGVHVGPGAVAVTVFQPAADEAPLLAPLA